MNTPNQLSDTPRTDAAWAKTFEDDDDQCRAGNAATDMRDKCATLERELTALTAERDQLRASEARATAELRDSLALEQDMGNAAYDELRVDCDELRADVVRLTAERDQLRADYERACQTVAQMHAAAVGEVCGPRRGIVEDLSDLRAEVERYRLVTLRQDAELATEREKVRVLREALENLRDEQNGVPLYTREEQWKQAMDGAEAALAATEAKP